MMARSIIACVLGLVIALASTPSSGADSAGYCGEAPATATKVFPRGMTSDRQPTIRAVFADADVPCLHHGGAVFLDGRAVASATRETQDGWEVSHTPDEPLLPGRHDVTILLWETCCRSDGHSNFAIVNWSFGIWVPTEDLEGDWRVGEPGSASIPLYIFRVCPGNVACVGPATHAVDASRTITTAGGYDIDPARDPGTWTHATVRVAVVIAADGRTVASADGSTAVLP